MSRTRNEVLAAWMAEHKVTARELADQVNAAIADFTGRYGTLGERGVYRWLSGEHTWPNTRQRIALERVTGRTAVQLGFRPRGKNSTTPSPPEEDPVHRRTFIAATTAAGASLAAPAAANSQRRLGSADVDRVKAELAAWVGMDNRYGGTRTQERRAVSMARETLDLLQHNTASSRVRSELYAVAASFSNSAMWAAIDGRRLDAAQQHLNRTVTLAGLSGDSAAQFRVWGHAAILYQQLGRPADALAAAEASRATAVARRDPFYASLALARLSTYHAKLNDPRNALRYLDLAQEAFDRADPGLPRPPWMGFHDQAELDGQALITHLILGRWDDAERHAHRSLARLRPDLERNRALTYADLALAQLGQGDIEPAVASARTIPARIARQGRVRKRLDDFTRRLTALAPRSFETGAWREHYRAVAV
ncbi:MAG TPA: Tat pathway signal protein [Streptomyces sp.]|uniref:Tat pathway signal protein n=1 Tax=Streptomyces sp. TaxID=1931 RepID=UPI002D53FF0A|nr:Tat pathway signal protein [Streptomyces sp.]HZG06069.1 Tat pathway signal protein [Streptomyces sp.]